MKWQLVLGILLVSSIFSCTKPAELPDINVYGHSGTSLHKDRTVYPANSAESILYALDILDADGVEVDVQMTKDSVLVLFHDTFLHYTTPLSGCISSYNYSEIEHLKLDNSKYIIVTLKTILELCATRQKQIYLDIKSVDFCTESQLNPQTFDYAFEKATQSIPTSYLSKIIIGSRQSLFLQSINFSNKCFETINVPQGIETATNYQFNSLLFFINHINTTDVDLLKNSNLNWGLIGLKDKWLIDKAINYHPNFIISDNIAYTNKQTK